MRLRNLWVSLLLLLFLIFFWLKTDLFQDLIFQSQPKKPVIKTFNGFKWGTSRNHIIQEMGSITGKNVDVKSVFEGSSNPGKEILYKNRYLLGESTNIGYVFHPDHGLVKGIFSIPIPKSKNCKDLFLKYQKAIAKAYPELEGRWGRNNPPSGKEFCESVQRGEAGRVAQWEDHRGALITMMMGINTTDKIVILFETPKFKQWKNNVTSHRGWLRWISFKKQSFFRFNLSRSAHPLGVC